MKIKQIFYQNLKLKKEESVETTYEEIKEGAYFKGYNLWILFFAMFIACIGLNTNSTSAVIGAMLISPLMGPIVGFSFGLAINDFGLKKKSLNNWFLMTIISLLASTIFFLISPFDNNTEAIKSFTKASIFDILLAFFGGLAGFIGIIKKEGTKVIAGVAVATACMPPLCTAGFGIAHNDFTIFFGGMYFYLINCLFIGLATFVLARANGYHISFRYTTTLNKTANILWSIFIFLMIIPGTYIAYKKYKEEYSNPTSINTDLDKIKLLEIKVQQLDSILKTKK